MKRPKRSLAVILIGLGLVAVALAAAVMLVGDRLSYTDQAVDIEIVPPATPR